MNRPKGLHLVTVLFLILICYLSFFRGLGEYALWDPDEGRSGVIAKEVVASGNWVTLTRNGDPYYDKPVLYFWLVALGLKLLGVHEFAVRLPSALAAGLTVGIVCLWGCVSKGWKLGLWAGLVLATSAEFVALARFGNTDMVFTLFFTAALICFLWWKEKGKGKGWLWLFYLLLALASLTKGPVGVLLPLLIVGTALGLQKRWDLLKDMRLPQGIAVALLASGPWYLLAALRDPDYIKTFLWKHNVLRFFVSQQGIDHPEPAYFLLLVLAGGFLPWIIFLPAVLHNFWEHRGGQGQEHRLFLVVWVAAVLTFFSLAQNKLGTYILPAFPPLALLTGDLLVQFIERQESRPWRHRWILYGSLTWLVLLLAISPVSEMILKNRYPQYFPLNLPLFPTSLFLLSTALAWILRQEKWVPWLVSLSSLWLTLWFYGVKAQEISEVRSARTLARIVNGNTRKGYRVVAIRADSFSFYLSNHVQVVSHPLMIEDMLKESVPTVALVKEKHLKEMRSRIFVWKTVPSASALVANFPPPAQALGRLPKL